MYTLISWFFPDENSIMVTSTTYILSIFSGIRNSLWWHTRLSSRMLVFPWAVYSYVLFCINFLQFSLSSLKINLKSLWPSRRVFCQIQTWLGRDENICCTDCGRRAENQNLFPVLTDEPLIPVTLLKRFYCDCKKGCGSNCSCRKNGNINFNNIISKRWSYNSHGRTVADYWSTPRVNSSRDNNSLLYNLKH